VTKIDANNMGERPAALSGPTGPFASVAGDARRAGSAELVDPLTDGRWEAFVARAPAAYVFHHRAWLGLLAWTNRYPITACCIVDATGEIRAGAPLALVPGLLRRRLVCLPLSDRCAPLPDPDDDPALAARLIGELDEMRRAMGLRLELRGAIAPAASARVVGRYLQHDVPLEGDVDAVVGRFRRRSQLLRGARRAERAGLVVERRTDTRALAEFYRLSVAMRRRQGGSRQRRRFIVGLAHLFDRGLGFVLLVRDCGRPIAAAIFFTFNGVLGYYRGAWDAAASGERLEDLLLLEAIRRGCRSGMRTLDLGRTHPGDEELRASKLSWGARERTVEHYELAGGAARSGGLRLRRGGAPLIRRRPAVASRLAGEALDRDAS
jgi:hypothetical protein